MHARRRPPDVRDVLRESAYYLRYRGRRFVLTPNANPGDPTPRLGFAPSRDASRSGVSPRGAQPRAGGRLQRRATVEKK